MGSPGQSVYFNTWDRYDDSWDGTIWQFTDKPTSDPTHQVVFTSWTPNGGDQTSGNSWDGSPERLEVTFELKWWDPQPLVVGYSHNANGTMLSGGGGSVSSGGIITINGTPLASGVYNYSIPLIGCAGNATGTITVTQDNIVSAPSRAPTLCVNTPLTDITIRTKNHIMVTNVGSPAEIPNLNLPKPQYMNFWPTVNDVDGDGTLDASDPVHAWIDIPNTNINSADYDWMSGNNGGADHRYTFSFMMIHNSNNELLNIDWRRWSDEVGGDNFYIYELATNSGDNYKNPGAPGIYYPPNSDGFTLSGDNGGNQASGTRSTTAEYICLYYYKQSPNAGIGDDRTYIRIRAASNPQSATGIGTVTGLPNGVSASWSGDEITISGTPSEVGVFNYIIPLTGGCGSVNATGTITVTQDNTAAAPSATPTLCNNTALTDITIATTGATGIGTATGLPSGVTASWSADEVTIIGTPSQVGTFNYSVPLTGGCGIVNATGSITVNYTPVADAPADVTACDNCTLPALTVGNYFSSPNGVGPVAAGTVITTTQTLYVYAETATTPNCTSENSFDVTINYTPVADAPADVTACDSYTLPALTVGNYFSSPNGVGPVAAGTSITTTQTLYVYAETATTPNCTSENSFTIIITPIDASTSLSGTTITANLFGVNYTWLDCENNYSVIPGQNTQTFSAFENGNYAVIVNDGSCLDTSECVIVNSVFMIENNLYEVSVYPNPTNNIITIKTANYHGEFEARMYDLSGRLLLVENKNTFSINSFSKGTYILRLVYANREEDFKVIKD